MTNLEVHFKTLKKTVTKSKLLKETDPKFIEDLFYTNLDSSRKKNTKQKIYMHETA